MKMQGDRRGFLHLQKNLICLEKGRFDVLNDDGFVTGLAGYLFELSRSQYHDFAHNILNVLGECAVQGEQLHREKALFVLSLYAESALKDDNDQAVQALSWIFARWLRQERDFLSCFEYVCNQIQLLLKRMLQRGLFCQLMLWLQLFDAVAGKELRRPPAIQAVVSRLHQTLTGQLRKHRLETGGNGAANPDEVECLQRFQADNNADRMVEELYTSPDRQRRLTLIETLSELEDEVAYVLIEKLGVDAPWYAIRNAVQIIGRLKTVRHFHLVKPFLEYPDVRVQQQVISFISRLDRERALEQLLRGLEVCDDSLKFQLIQRLSVTGNKAAEKALLRVLLQRDRLDQAIRDDIVLLLCTELSHFPSDNVVAALDELLAERKQAKGSNDPIVIRAGQTIKLISSR
jgi:hypothetical protein